MNNTGGASIAHVGKPGSEGIAVGGRHGISWRIQLQYLRIEIEVVY
jgi:hypothetical protein